MFTQEQRLLLEETEAFYAHVASQFSQTRQLPWEGWQKLLSYLPNKPFSLLDVAAGNCRFERFLTEGNFTFQATAIDSCLDLVEAAPNTTVICANLFESKLAELEPEHADVVVSFGFLHHIPGAKNREMFLYELLDRVRPGGICAVSFWQFAKDKRIASKAREVSERYLALHPNIQLEEGDYLLGWRGLNDVFRFCHHFNDAEIEALATSVSQSLHKQVRILSYAADGKTHNLNRYLLLFPE